MVKQILTKCVELLNRDDILNELKNSTSISDITNNLIKNDVERLINYYNFTISNIFENYIFLEENELLLSDENNRIYFSNFKYKPIKIKNVLNTSMSSTNYTIHTTFISTNSQYTNYNIYYNYVPNEVSDINDEITHKNIINDKIVCYGVVSEFLASKDQYEKSEFWKDKFLFELFKLKTKKGRRLKSNFLR